MVNWFRIQLGLSCCDYQVLIRISTEESDAVWVERTAV